MRKIIALWCCLFMFALYGNELITLNNNTGLWKKFQWVQDGEIIQHNADSLLIKSEYPGKGMHYFFDREIVLTPGDEVQVDFEYKGTKNPQVKRCYINCGMYMFKNGKYLIKAIPLGSAGLANNGTWKSFVKTLKITGGNLGNADKVKFFISLTAGGEVEIKKFKFCVKKIKAVSALKNASVQKAFIEPDGTFELGKYWTKRKLGKKDFYVTELGNYVRIKPEEASKYYQCGLFPAVERGYWSLNNFVSDKNVPAWKQESLNAYFDGLPFASMNYQRMHGNPRPSAEIMKKVDHLWFGDGQPEEPIYRLEPVFHFLKTGKKWQGSSMYLWKDAEAIKYFKNDFLPALEKALPGASSPDYVWTREKLQILKDIYCLTYLAVNDRPMVYTMYLSPFVIAENTNNVAVSAKAGDAAGLALLRGVAKQAGGNKFYACWRGHEPLERYSVGGSIFLSGPERFNWGLPFAHAKYYIYRPYLADISHYTNESFPGSLIEDYDQNGVYHPTFTGRLVKEMVQFAEDNPERGTMYTPAALVMGYDRAFSNFAYFNKINYDDADWMNYALLNDLLLPEHRHARNSGEYTNIAPYGELMDILKPDYHKKIDADIFDGYKLLILGGGITLNDDYKKVLEDFVSKGGILLINAADAKKYFNTSFTGVKIDKIISADSVVNEITKRRFNEKKFNYYDMTLQGAKTVYSANNKPLVTLFKYGKGNVMIHGSQYMVNAEKTLTIEARTKTRTLRPLLLTFNSELFENLFDSVAPFTVKVDPENREDFTWTIFKKGNNWTVTVYNYSLKREELKVSNVGTARVIAEYPYKSVPFEIIPNVPVKDVVELFERRDVNYQNRNGKMIVCESMRGGDLRMYEFSNEKITLRPVERFKNYALNRPLEVSSTYRDFKAGYAVDGKRDRNYYWLSGGKRKFEMPQYMTVDLGENKNINRVFLELAGWNDFDIRVRKHFMRFKIYTSLDNKNFKLAVDESLNTTPAELGGYEYFFAETSARYVKVEFLYNSGNAGAGVIEFEVSGREKEKIYPERKKIVPAWEVKFPDAVTKAEKVKYLMDMKPLYVKPGWMPPGKTWQQMNGWVKLYPEVGSREGAVCTKSLYAESVFEAEYAIPAGAKYFAATCGIGTRSRVASVEFQVFLDGKKVFDSGIFRIGQPLLMVCIDVSNGKKLKLVTTDGRDGIVNDYAWYGDARFTF